MPGRTLADISRLASPTSITTEPALCCRFNATTGDVDFWKIPDGHGAGTWRAAT